MFIYISMGVLCLMAYRDKVTCDAHQSVLLAFQPDFLQIKMILLKSCSCSLAKLSALQTH